ncbi:MAG TPA: glycosyltransferase family 87 protein [Ktedonobacterales bacterium]|nr:glycosyltransferase family 87 protein [Ktedonobacterales bacterium]
MRQSANQIQPDTVPENAHGEKEHDEKRLFIPTAGRAVLVALAGVTLLVVVGHWALTVVGYLSSESGRYDFSTYYAAAAALRANLHATIYDPATMARAGAQNHTLVNPPLPYTYPPLFAILLSPFTVLSFRVLSRLWLLTNEALWIVLTFFFASELRLLLGNVLRRQPQASAAIAVAGASGSVAAGPMQPQASGLRQLLDDPTPLVALAIAAVVSLGFEPAYQTIMTGQVNFLVLALLAPVPLLSRQRHERWVGVLLALATLLKFTPAILIVYLVLRRRWEALLATLVALAGVSLLCIAVVGPGVFFAAIPQASQVGAHDALNNHNEALLAPLGVALGPTARSSLTFKLVEYLTLGALALAIGVVLWWAPARGPVATASMDAQAKRIHNEVEALTYGMALCAMVLLSPTIWVHHYLWLLPAVFIGLGVTLRRVLETPLIAGVRLRAWGLLALITLATLALGWGLPYGWDSDPHPRHTSLFGVTLWPGLLEQRPLGGLALLMGLALLLMAYRGRDGRDLA